MAIAAGKTNANRVNIGDRILVKHYDIENEADRTALTYLGKERALGIATTKTGAGVTVARVTGKELSYGGAGARQTWTILTTEGPLENNAGHQTMMLAPEDAAGVKRAHVEALALDAIYEAYPLASVEDQDEAMDEAADRAEMTAELERRVDAEYLGSETERLDLEAQDEPETSDECEAKGCDIPEGLGECRRCGAELLVIEDDDLTPHSQDGKVDNMNEASDTETPDAPAQTKHTGSSVVALIERVWDRIRADHPELPEVVVTTGSGEGVKWGHFRPNSWKLEDERRHEFFLASEALAKGATQVLQTTIHEAAHTLSKARGIQDTSRQGRWHNAEFKKAAVELGLEHKATKADSQHGFSFVTLTADTKAKYADLLDELERELKLTGLLPFWLGGTDEEDQGGEKITGKPKGGEGDDEAKPKSGNLKATCDCEAPLIIRLSQKVLDLGVVRCDDCKQLFTAA